MRPLRHGDTIGIVSPASRPDDMVYSFSKEFFHQRGYSTKVFGMDDAVFGRMAADDQARIDNFHAAISDESIGAVFCTRGGYGSGRLLERINYDAFRDAQKIFVGYSDVTSILLSLASRTKLVTFHGPMMIDFMSKADAWTIARFFDVLTGQAFEYTLRDNAFTPVACGEASGKLVGGNISILESISDILAKFRKDKIILLLEDVNEYAYRIDRALVNFRRMGLFENVAGILLADVTMRDAGADNSLGMTWREIVEMHFRDFHGPIAMNLPCGHTAQQMTLPIGAQATMQVSATRCVINFEDFWDRRSCEDMAA